MSLNNREKIEINFSPLSEKEEFIARKIIRETAHPVFLLHLRFRLKSDRKGDFEKWGKRCSKNVNFQFSNNYSLSRFQVFGKKYPDLK
jgi:hypothetical protein